MREPERTERRRRFGWCRGDFFTKIFRAKRYTAYSILQLFGPMFEFPIRFFLAFFLAVFCATSLAAELRGSWHASDGKAVSKLSRLGGSYVFRGNFDSEGREPLVIDFRNTGVIGKFSHRIYDENGRLVAMAEGGIESAVENPFFLRHGREFSLQKGRYRLETAIDSPFYLADPVPYVDTLSRYRQAIKPGNALTLFCLGLLFGLGIYYAAISAARWERTEAMYSLFILGNLLYNGTSLLVFPDLFGIHWFYLVSLPILFSNCAYIVFVMSLLEIEKRSWLHRIGMAVLGVLSSFIVFSALLPHRSLEFDRYGVGIFLCYGLIAGFSRARKGNPVARYYLLAIFAFFVLGSAAISLNGLEGIDTLTMEHVGLVAVTVEALLLALVLARQFAMVHREREDALGKLLHSQKMAQTDMLTGLPNRYALETSISGLPESGSLTFIDLDGLKHYNDTFGHRMGDALLCRFAEVLAMLLPLEAKLHRLGGDEFAITCTRSDPSCMADLLRESILQLRKEGFECAGASSGTVSVSENPQKDKLMQVADERMYADKHRNRDPSPAIPA